MATAGCLNDLEEIDRGRERAFEDPSSYGRDGQGCSGPQEIQDHEGQARGGTLLK